MQSDMIERGNLLFAVFGLNPQTCGFQDFFNFVAVGSFTADGGLLQPTGRCKDNTSQVPFSQCESLQGIRVQVRN